MALCKFRGVANVFEVLIVFVCKAKTAERMLLICTDVTTNCGPAPLGAVGQSIRLDDDDDDSEGTEMSAM
jgi:hypothetical protein